MQHQHPAQVLPFRRPVEGLTPSDRVLLRLVDEAEQRIEPIRPTAVERKLHEQQVRHYTRLGREVRKSNGERLTDALCIALVAWTVAYFIWQFAGRPWL